MSIKKTVTSILATGLVAGGIVAGLGLSPATSAPAEAATCCLAIPNGTWGGYIRTIDVHMYYKDRWTEIRRKTVIKWRMVDGRWQERVYSVELYTVRHV